MRRQRALAAVGLVSAALAVLALATGTLDRVEPWSIDQRFAVRGPERVSDVAVIAIDDADIAASGHWPIPRRLHGRAIDVLRRAGVRGIAYDVQFTEPSGSRADDAALYAAVARAKGTVLATTTVRADGDTDVLGGGRTWQPRSRGRPTACCRRTSGARSAASAPSLQDVHPVPTSGSGMMPGPEVQANAISTVMRGLPLRESPCSASASA